MEGRDWGRGMGKEVMRKYSAVARGSVSGGGGGWGGGGGRRRQEEEAEEEDDAAEEGEGLELELESESHDVPWGKHVQVLPIAPTNYEGERAAVNSADLRGWKMLSYLVAAPYVGPAVASITQTLWSMRPLEVPADDARGDSLREAQRMRLGRDELTREMN